MIETLKQVNNKLIELNKDNEEELHKYKLIENILNQKNCFLNINIEYAYAILRDLQVPEVLIKDVYKKLINPVAN